MMADFQDFAMPAQELNLDMPDSLLPGSLEESDMDACSSFNYTIFCEQENVKRRRAALAEEEEILRSQAEVKRLRRINCLLQSSMRCVTQRIDAARTEQQCLKKMMCALHTYKSRLKITVDEGWIESNLKWLGRNQDPTDQFMTFESPNRPEKEPKTACALQKTNQRRTLPSAGQDKANLLPSRLEEDPNLADFAAIAAAALAANEGRPASALIDLLVLAENRSAYCV